MKTERLINMHRTKISHISNKKVIIDRRTKWGNKHILVDETDMDERMSVLWKYTLDLLRNPKLLGEIDSLEGKTLCCWCKPYPCHGEILNYLVDNPQLVARCGRACTDKECIAEQVFEGLGWEHKKSHIQATLF